MLALGQTIDRYTVETLIGTGGTAVVYRVRHRSLGTKHALKILTISSRAIRKRMLQEGRVQATLHHPNIVAVNDVLEIDGAPGLLMEYIAGPSLERAFKKHRFSLEEAETLFRGILSGVHRAHEHGLVHRDLKPANVLLQRVDGGLLPKVTDFGIAKVVQGGGDVGVTRSGIAMGTPQYMAPEQIRDARTVDRRADIFSLGCLLYELVTQQRTFPSDDMLETYNAIGQGRFIHPLELMPELPERFVDAIMGCLETDRDGRISDCQVLNDVLTGERRWRDRDLTEEDSLADDDTDTIPIFIGSEQSKVGPTLVDGGHEEETYEALLADPNGTLVDLQTDETEVLELRYRRGIGGWFGAAVLVIVVGLAGGAWMADSSLGSLLGFSADSGDRAVSEASDAPAVGVGSESEASGAVGGEPAGLEPAEEGVVPVGSSSSESTSLAGERIPNQPPEPGTTVENDDQMTRTTSVSPPEPVARPVRVKRSVSGTLGNGAMIPIEDEPVLGPVTVKLMSTPPTAEIRVDGVQQGVTPSKLTLRDGSHVVEMKSGATSQTFRIEVVAGMTNMWCYVFESESLIEGRCPR